MKEKITLKEWGILMLGMFLVAFSVYYIMIPCQFVVGSISGVVMIVSHYVPALSFSTISFILNVVLLTIGFIFVGKDFGGKTVIASILMPLYLRVFEIITPNVEAPTGDIFIDLACYILVVSIGQALLFNINASSGGLDIIAKIMNQYLHIDIGKGAAMAGFVTASLSILVYDKKTLIVSLVGTYIGGIVLDHFLDGFNIRKKVCILSSRHEEIQEFIVKKLDRGATLYQVHGAWGKTGRTELVTILQNNEYADLLEFVNQIDPSAFITVTTVGQVIGNWNKNRRRQGTAKHSASKSE